MRKRIFCLLASILCCTLIVLFCVEKRRSRIEDEITNGNFSRLSENELVNIEEIEWTYESECARGNIEWRKVDLNGDDICELIWVEKDSYSEERKRIVAIFTQGEKKECVLWDVADYSEYFFLGNEGNLIYYTQYFGVYNTVRFENYVYDENWNQQMVYALSVYEIYDISQMEWWKDDHPDMKENGIYYRKEGNESEQVKLTEGEFVDLYRQMAGHEFELSFLR